MKINKEDVKYSKEPVGGFVFYRSYFEAIELLSAKNKLIAYEAIVEYALNGEEAKVLPSRVSSIMKLATPLLDANRQKYLKKLKTKSQTTEKQTSDIFNGELAQKVALPKKEVELERSDNLEEIDTNDFIC